MLRVLHCPLSGPDLIYISLLIILCIIEYVMNKRTLNLVYPLRVVGLGPGTAAKVSLFFSPEDTVSVISDKNFKFGLV